MFCLSGQIELPYKDKEVKPFYDRTEDRGIEDKRRHLWGLTQLFERVFEPVPRLMNERQG